MSHSSVNPESFGEESAESLDPQEMGRLAARVGDAFMGAGLFEEAIGEYKRAAALDEGTLEWQINLGDAYATSGHYRRALKTYRKAIRKDASDAQARCSLAELWARLGNFPAAIEEMKVAVGLRPESHYYQYRFHTLLWGAGLRGEALVALMRAVRACPEQAFYRFKLGRVLLERGKARAAARQFRAAATLAPADAYYRLWLAIALFRAQCPEEAAATAEEGATRSTFYEPVCWSLAGYIHAHLGKNAEARRCAARVGRLSGYDLHLLRMLQRVAGHGGSPEAGARFDRQGVL